MKTYYALEGYYDATEDFNVYVRNGSAVYKLEPRLDVENKSPTGFSWGYLGSGPAQLSLAILCDLKGVRFAKRNFQTLKQNLIATLPQDEGFSLTEVQIMEALK